MSNPRTNPLTPKALFAQHRRLSTAMYIDEVYRYITGCRDGVDAYQVAKHFDVSVSRAWYALRVLVDTRSVRSKSSATTGLRGRPRAIFFSNTSGRRKALDAASNQA